MLSQPKFNSFLLSASNRQATLSPTKGSGGWTENMRSLSPEITTYALASWVPYRYRPTEWDLEEESTIRTITGQIWKVGDLKNSFFPTQSQVSWMPLRLRYGPALDSHLIPAFLFLWIPLNNKRHDTHKYPSMHIFRFSLFCVLRGE